MPLSVRHFGAGLIAVAFGLGLGIPPSVARIVRFDFDAVLFTGPLAVTYFDGTGSYNDRNLTGVGVETTPLTSLDFTLHGFRITLNNCVQNRDVSILNDVPFSFSCSAQNFQNTTATPPVSNISLGYGGSYGNITYFTQGTDPGSGVFVLDFLKTRQRDD